MAAKKYEVVIDVQSGSVKIAGGEMLSLNQQVRILQKELGKVDGKEFELLSSKLNETKDRAATVNARSRELFGTLSLLPGPVGMFASKIDGAISLMKVFSGFKLADIKAQFVALGADIADIGKKIFAATGIQKIFQVTTTATAAVLRAVGIQATAASVGVRAFSTALVATGVGALVVGLGYLVTAFMNTKSAGEQYEEQLKKIQAQQDANRLSTERYYERQIAEARALGKSEVEIQKLRLKGAQEAFDDTKKAYEQLRTYRVDMQDIDKEYYKASAEQEKKLFEDLLKAEQNLDLEKSAMRGAERQATEAANKKRLDDNKAYLDKKKRQEIEQVNALIALEKAKDQRDKQSFDRLKELLLQKFYLEKDNIEMTSEMREVAAAEALRQAEEEMRNDVRIYEEGLEKKREANQRFIDQELTELRISIEQKTLRYEELKQIYGEDSIEAIRQNGIVLQAKKLYYDKEVDLLSSFLNSTEGLSKTQSQRLEELVGTLTQKTDAHGFLVMKGMQRYAGEMAKIQLDIIANYDEELTAIYKKAEDTFVDRQKEITSKLETTDKNNFTARIKLLKQSLSVAEEERQKLNSTNEQIALDRKKFLDEQVTSKEYANDLIVQSDEDCVKRQGQIQENFLKKQRDVNAELNQIVEERAIFNNDIVQSVAGTMNSIASFLYDIGGKNKKAQKAAVVIDKAAAIGRIISETAVANAKAVKASPLTGGMPWVALNTASAAASTLSVIGSAVRAIREIDAVSTDLTRTSGVINVVARRAMGGIVSGPGTSTSDSIPTMLSNGEFVMNANASRMFAPILSQLNSLGNQPQFSMGSLLTQAIGNTTLGATIDQDMENRTTPPIKTYVSATDMSNQQQMDRLIKSRSLI